MKKVNKAALAACLALATGVPALAQDTGSAAPSATESAPAALTSASVLANVNGQDITLGHVIATRQALPEQYQSLPDAVLLEGILEQLIQQTVLSQAITELSARAELQLENERRALVAGEKIDEVTAAAVTDEALQTAYESAYADADPVAEFNASHILVETEEEAADLITKLDEGAMFADLAREYSTGPSGPNGGELGWFTEGMMVKPFEDAVLGLEVGQVAGPVQTQFGWHVLVLNDKRDKAVPPLEEVRDALAEQIQNDAVETVVATLVEAAQIDRVDLTTIDAAALRDDALLD